MVVEWLVGAPKLLVSIIVKATAASIYFKTSYRLLFVSSRLHHHYHHYIHTYLRTHFALLRTTGDKRRRVISCIFHLLLGWLRTHNKQQHCSQPQFVAGYCDVQKDRSVRSTRSSSVVLSTRRYDLVYSWQQQYIRLHYVLSTTTTCFLACCFCIWLLFSVRVRYNVRACFFLRGACSLVCVHAVIMMMTGSSVFLSRALFPQQQQQCIYIQYHSLLSSGLETKKRTVGCCFSLTTYLLVPWDRVLYLCMFVWLFVYNESSSS